MPRETSSVGSAPVNLEVEQALLGAVLINNDAYERVSGFLEPRHFSEPLHARIFEIIKTIIEKGRSATPVTVKMFLPKDLDVAGMSGASYLARLAAEATTVLNAADYGRVIQRLSTRRAIADTLQDSLDLARGATSEEWDDPEVHIDEIEGRLEEIRSADIYRPGAVLSEVVDGVLTQSSDAYKNNVPIGLDWFLPGIERLSGSRPEQGDLIGILGASGDAKTSFALQYGTFLAERGIPFQFKSGEQSQAQCIRQMISQRIGLNARDVRQGKISEKEFGAMVDFGRGQLAKMPIRVETWSEMTVGQLAVSIRSFRKQLKIPDGDPFLVAIDHAKKILPDRSGETLAQQVFQTYNGLKDVAKSLGCIILLLMQRNSEFTKRRVMAPVKGDAYGGEGTIQNLDLCYGLFRPSRWLRERAKIEDRDDIKEQMLTRATVLDAQAGSLGKDGIGLAQISTLKARFGDDQAEPLDLRFVGPYTRFEPLPEPDVIDDGQEGWEM